MMANMAASLIQHERIVTTPPKAKEAKRFVERLITLAKKGGVPERRMVMALLQHKTIPGTSARGKPTWVKITRKLFGDLATRFAGRNGGYTRIIRIGGSRRGEGPSELRYRLGSERRTLRLAGNRLGDNAQQVILEFVGAEVGAEVGAQAEQAPEEKKE